MTAKLPEQTARLDDLVAQINDGVDAAAEALAEIKRDRLWELRHRTWADFCRTELGKSERTIRRMLMPPREPTASVMSDSRSERPSVAAGRTNRTRPSGGDTVTASTRPQPKASGRQPVDLNPQPIDAQSRDITAAGNPPDLAGQEPEPPLTMAGLVQAIVSLDPQAAAAALDDASYRSLMAWMIAVQAARRPAAINPPAAGRRRTEPEPASRCPHPPNRRVGDVCMVCGATVKP